MACHRLLQRGFAKLYGYSLREADVQTNPDPQITPDHEALTEYANVAVLAESWKDLHYKMKGARDSFAM